MPIQRMYVLWCDGGCGQYHEPPNAKFASEVGEARKLARVDGWRVASNTKMSDQSIWCPQCRRTRLPRTPRPNQVVLG